MRSRPYADADLHRLQEALAGWIGDAGDCGYCHVGELPHRIYENLRGRRPVGELVRIWEDATDVAGVEINCRFDNAFDVFTCPRLRGTAAELDMLRAAAETTRHFVAAAREDTTVITDVFDCDRVRADLLASLGFEPYRIWDHLNEVRLDTPMPAPTLPAGFRVRSATLADCEQLASARNDAFDSDWSGASYREEVMRKPGYDSERELVVVAPAGDIAAFIVIWLDEVNRVGHFEPVGTRRAFQRRGLARALMLHGLHEMRRHRMATATVEHGASNLAAAALYLSLGFRKKYETLGYQRPA